IPPQFSFKRPQLVLRIEERMRERDDLGGKTGVVGGPRSRRLLRLGPLLGSIEQDSLHGGVEIPTHLRDALIAILAKEARRLVVFKYSPAFLVLKQNHSERRIKSSRELMASHF